MKRSSACGQMLAPEEEGKASIGEKLDEDVKSYIRAVRECGGVIMIANTIAAGTAIVRSEDRNLLTENGGPIT